MPRHPASPLARFFGWSFGGLALAVVGGAILWKWRQVNASGVPLGFALKRTFSEHVGEGSLGLIDAYRKMQQEQGQGS